MPKEAMTIGSSIQALLADACMRRSFPTMALGGDHLLYSAVLTPAMMALASGCMTVRAGSLI
jgi:hypothetical protein